jgi:hypothetical protein
MAGCCTHSSADRGSYGGATGGLADHTFSRLGFQSGFGCKLYTLIDLVQRCGLPCLSKALIWIKHRTFGRTCGDENQDSDYYHQSKKIITHVKVLISFRGTANQGVEANVR